MLVLVEKFGRAFKFPSRLDYHHHHNQHSHDDEEALLASSSLRAFRSEISRIVNQILKEGKPGLELDLECLSLAWNDKCLEAIPMIHRAFAALVVDIDHPMAKWDVISADEYLNYSLIVLDLLNKVSFSLSHLGQARLSLAHGLTLFQNSNLNSKSSSSSSFGSKHLLPVSPKKSIGKDLKLHGHNNNNKGNEEKPGSGKDFVIREALLIMKSTGMLLLGFMISGLCSDGNLYSVIRNSIGRLSDPSVTSLDSILSKEILKNGGYMVVKEVREVNAAVARMDADANDNAAKELSTKLEFLESFLKNIGKQTDNLFSGVLAARNKLLDTVRYRQKN